MRMKTEPRVLLLDIETLANLKEIMKILPGISNYPGLSMKASLNSVICFGYMWSDDKKAKVVSAWDDSKKWAKDVNDDSYVLERILEIVHDADIVVTHNGRRFDWKFIQTRLLKHGLAPMRKTIHVDTCSIARQHLYLFNNKLDTLAKFFTDEEKMENGGWELWCKVLERDKKSMELMEKYCAQDVKTLQAVYQKLRPFITSMPNMNIIRSGEDFVCPKCGSTRIMRRGTGHNKSGSYHKVYCSDCLSWSSMKDETKQPKPI